MMSLNLPVFCHDVKNIEPATWTWTILFTFWRAKLFKNCVFSN